MMTVFEKYKVQDQTHSRASLLFRELDDPNGETKILGANGHIFEESWHYKLLGGDETMRASNLKQSLIQEVE